MYYYKLISSMLKAPISTLLTGLYAVYKGESNANDSYTGGYNGTAYGGITYTTGKSGNAFTFNGTSNTYIKLPDVFKLSDSGSDAYSISLWGYLINTGQPTGLFTNFMQNDPGTILNGWMIWHSGERIRFNRCDGTSTSASALVTSVVGMNSWNHIVLTRKNGSTKLYVNNVLLASDTSTVNTVYTTTHKPLLGARNSYNPDYYDWFSGNGAKIDEVNVWTKELTATEVTELYNSGTGKFYPTF